MWTAENLRDDFGICLRGIDHRDILAMDHDVAHFEVAKIQNAAQHVAVDLHHATFVMMEVDRAAQFFVRGKHLLLVIHVETENPERVTDDELHGRGDGTEQKDDDLALFGDAGVVYATLVMTAVVLIFAEVAPKTFAITNTDRVALAVSQPLRIIIF